MNPNILHNHIEKLKFFEEFKKDELDYLSKILNNPAPYPAQHELFKEGEHGNDMFIIISGSIQVSYKNNILALLKENDTLGETALLKEDNHRMTTAIAQRNSQLLRISKEIMQKIENENTKVSSKIYKKIAETLSWKLQDEQKRDCKVFCIQSNPQIATITF